MGNAFEEGIEDRFGDTEAARSGAQLKIGFARSVKIASARDEEIVFLGEVTIFRDLFRSVTAVVDLDPLQASRAKLVHNFFQVCTGGRLQLIRVREHWNTACTPGDFDRLRGGNFLLRHVRRAPGLQPKGEGLVGAGNVAPRDHRSRDMRLADAVAAGLRPHLFDREIRPQLAQASDDSGAPRGPVRLQTGEPTRQDGRRWIDPVGQEVHRSGFVFDREFQPRKQSKSPLICRDLRSLDATDGVVIGQAQHGETRLNREFDQFDRRKAAIGGRALWECRSINMRGRMKAFYRFFVNFWIPPELAGFEIQPVGDPPRRLGRHVNADAVGGPL